MVCGTSCGTSSGASSPSTASSSPCCPGTGHGALGEPEGYEPKGSMEDFNGTPCYVVAGGGGGGGDSGAALLVAHDVFGLGSGRTRQICDDLAASLGILVVAPVFWRQGGGLCGGASGAAIDAVMTDAKKKSWGTWLRERAAAAWHLPAWFRDIKAHAWDALAPRLQEEVLPRLRERGVERLGALGFCWGSWFVFHACTLPDFCCGVCLHPSQALLCPRLGEDLRQLCDAISSPQLVLSAADDSAATKEGGLADEVFQTKPFGKDCFFKTFPDMRHGWANRGDLEDEAIARDFAETMALVKDFLKKHLV